MPPRRSDFQPRPLRDRWEDKVDRTGDCWLWTGARDDNGYGKIQKGGLGVRVVVYAHRLAYEFYRGPIPEGLAIDHLCRNKSCVNPAHLEVVTLWENTRRGDGWTARRSKATHCIHGHEFTPKNTRCGGPDRKWRYCRTCASRHPTRSGKQRSQNASESMSASAAASTTS